MKANDRKNYIVPQCEVVELGAEAYMLLSDSQQGDPGRASKSRGDEYYDESNITGESRYSW